MTTSDAAAAGSEPDEDRLSELAEPFLNAQTVQDLVRVLRLALHIRDPKASTGWLTSRMVTALAFHGDRRYRSFAVPKKSGGERPIRAPYPKLKAVQRGLNLCFRSVFEPHRAAYGFVPGRSIADNAAVHVGRVHVLNLDLEGFFPSTSFRRVKTVLGLEPFTLTGTREPLGFLIANLCCDDGVLPQGAPTSPTLTNAVCQRLDRRLNRLARSRRVRYSRYADDLTFSSNVDPLGEPFEAEVRAVIAAEGYVVNEAKVRNQSKYVRQEVTGLTVNSRVNVPNRFIDDVRFSLTVWEKHGYDRAAAHFVDRYAHQYTGRAVPRLEHVLAGRIAFLSMVRGGSDGLVDRLRKRLTALEGGDAAVGSRLAPSRAGLPASLNPSEAAASVERILAAWERGDIQEAFDELPDGTRSRQV